MTMNYFRLASLLFLPAASVMAQQPAFYLQPQSQSVSIGATVIFKSGASGTSPVVYQWLLNNLILSGATNVSLVLTNVQLVQSGQYQIQASNDWGTVLSKAALLDVDPTFTQISLGRITADGGDSTGVAWGDYDADGF